ncbi:putative endoglucanase [Fusarium redolens]|uniref:lytic cellulose monooxygenase (C4-dehydrogenating) n=1 Tax=Fusarium redolens TaxID=48865 RepID=A0A9P9K1F3_FUSRE|nr:putative endoglucanase [Fusarium redolens]KAH7244543.1 putative endoglucanase [Fusarium redolens]
MKISLASLAAMVPFVSAHYFFDVLVIDGKETNSMQYVRSNTRDAKYNPTKWDNIRDDMTPDKLDFRCNKGAFTFAGQTETAEIKAGSKLAMKLAVGATMQHPGPALVYMSKAPTTADAYEGDGEWFKIFEESVCNKDGDFTRDAWCTWDKDRIEFTIPADLPDGEYLIRPEHIGVHGAHVGQAEFYNTCAQVKVTGGGSGVPGPTVKFPGAYKKDDPSFNFSIYGGFKEYPMPGPAVWTSGNSGSGSDDTTDVTNNTTVPDEAASTGAGCTSRKLARRGLKSRRHMH